MNIVIFIIFPFFIGIMLASYIERKRFRVRNEVESYMLEYERAIRKLKNLTSDVDVDNSKSLKISLNSIMITNAIINKLMRVNGQKNGEAFISSLNLRNYRSNVGVDNSLPISINSVMTTNAFIKLIDADSKKNGESLTFLINPARRSIFSHPENLTHPTTGKVSAMVVENYC